MTVVEENVSRNFKGIWIPKEIWLHPDLDCFEKVLWAEIDSLDNEERGCTASNAYLQKFFNIKERCLQLGLAKLKKLGLIYYESFDGRTRKLRSCLKTTHEKFDTPPVSKITPQGSQILHPYNKGYKKEDSVCIPPTPPPVLFFEKEDIKMPKVEYERIGQKYGLDALQWIIEDMILYSREHPDKFAKYKSHASVAESWIRKNILKGNDKWKTQNKASHPKSTNYRPDSSANAMPERQYVTLGSVLLMQ